MNEARWHDVTSAEKRHQLCEQLRKRWLLIGRRMKSADKTDQAALRHKRIVIDHLIREIKMNAVLLHDAQRGTPFPETLVGQFSLLDEIVKRLQP
jgi:hypothetical protein